jgi:hypothetical protein
LSPLVGSSSLSKLLGNLGEQYRPVEATSSRFVWVGQEEIASCTCHVSSASQRAMAERRGSRLSRSMLEAASVALS